MISLIPTSILPSDGIVLIPPMPLTATIKTRINSQQFGDRLLAHGFDGLLSIEIKGSIPIHEVSGNETILWTQRWEHGGEGCNRGRLGHDFNFVQLIKNPETKRNIHALARALHLRQRLVGTARDPNIVNNTVASNRALNETSKSYFSLLSRTLLADRGRLSFQDPLAVQPDLHGLIAEADKDIVPLAVADIDSGIEVSPSTGQIDAKASSLSMGIDFPMRTRGLLAASDQDVERGLTIKFRAYFDSQRPLFEGSPTLRYHAALQGLAVFGSERRHATGGLARRRRALGDRLIRPSPILRLHSRRGIVQLRNEPLEPIEVIQQTAFGVLHGVIKNTDHAGITAGPDLTQDLEILGASADGQDLATLGIAADVHAIQVHAQEMRQHELQRFVQPVKVPVSVMKVVDDADVGDGVVLLQVLAGGHHVLRFATPATMVINRELTPNLRSLGDGRQEALCGALDLGFLSLPFAAGNHPDLRVQLILFEQPEGFFVIRPESEVFDTVFLICQNLLFEFGDMLRAPIISDLGETHLGHHRGALLRRALLVVERHDAPRRQVLLVIQRLSRQRSPHADH